MSDVCRGTGTVADRPRGDRKHESESSCAGSVLNLLQIAGFNHQVEIVQGVCQEECSSMLSSFFKELRKKKKQKKNTPETM